MGDIEKDRKEIKRLIKKSEIKEVNGMDYSDELEQTLTLMAEHTPDKEKKWTNIECIIKNWR